jgi:hypothetical protein
VQAAADAEESGASAWVIPSLPVGRRLELRILSTWGDAHYVGLAGERERERERTRWTHTRGGKAPAFKPTPNATRWVRLCVNAVLRCVLTVLRCVLTVPRCVLTLLRCVLTLLRAGAVRRRRKTGGGARPRGGHHRVAVVRQRAGGLRQVRYDAHRENVGFQVIT